MPPRVSRQLFTRHILLARPPSAAPPAGGVREGRLGGAEWPVPPQKQVREGPYGPGMAELEQQIAEHNILQKEIDAYGQQLRDLVGPVGEPPHAHPAPAPFPRQSPGWPAGLRGAGRRRGPPPSARAGG